MRTFLQWAESAVPNDLVNGIIQRYPDLNGFLIYADWLEERGNNELPNTFRDIANNKSVFTLTGEPRQLNIQQVIRYIQLHELYFDDKNNLRDVYGEAIKILAYGKSLPEELNHIIKGIIYHQLSLTMIKHAHSQLKKGQYGEY